MIVAEEGMGIIVLSVIGSPLIRSIIYIVDLNISDNLVTFTLETGNVTNLPVENFYSAVSTAEEGTTIAFDEASFDSSMEFRLEGNLLYIDGAATLCEIKYHSTESDYPVSIYLQKIFQLQVMV